MDKAYGRKIKTEFHEGNNKSIISFTVRHLMEGHPVLLGIRAPGGADHAVLVCGLEFERTDPGSDERPGKMPKPCRILVLDPGGYEVPPFMLWNSIIYPTPLLKGGYPYLFVEGNCNERKVSFDEALALWSID